MDLSNNTTEVSRAKQWFLKNSFFLIGLTIVSIGLYGAFKKVQSDRAASKRERDSLSVLEDWKNEDLAKVSNAMEYLASEGQFYAFKKAMEMEKSSSLEFRMIAARTLPYFPSEASFQAMNRLYNDTSPQVRLALFRSLGKSPNDQLIRWMRLLEKDQSLSNGERFMASVSLTEALAESNADEFAHRRKVLIETIKKWDQQ